MNGTQGFQRAPGPASNLPLMSSEGHRTHEQVALIQAEWGESQLSSLGSMIEVSGRITGGGIFDLGL